MRQDLDVVAGELDTAAENDAESNSPAADGADDDRNIFEELREDQ